jgi:hypothetical protein
MQRPDNASSDENIYKEGFPEIIKLGLPVVPIILETINWENQLDNNSPSFHLQHALREITKVHFGNRLENFGDKLERRLVYYSPNNNEYWQMWYRKSKEYTRTEFDVNIAAWHGIKNKNNPELKTEIKQRLTDIGVLVIPYLIEKINADDLELIPIISKLTDDNVAANSTKEQIITWWNKNKNRYTMSVTQYHFGEFQWWEVNGKKIKLPAKYISSTKTTVTIEQIDGRIIIIKISDLSEQNQKYVALMHSRQ